MTDNASITRPDAHDWENVTILSTKVQQFVRPGGHHPHTPTPHSALCVPTHVRTIILLPATLLMHTLFCKKRLKLEEYKQYL